MSALKDSEIGAWPENVKPRTIAGVRQYPVPGGPFVGVTTFLKVLGLGVEGLIKWSANEERKACLIACADVFAGEDVAGPAEFAAAVEGKLGAARQHAKLLAKAADIGSLAHERVNWWLRRELGEDAGPEPIVPEQSLWASMAFEDYWKESGLRIVRTEQTTWDPEHGYAGTIDIIAEDVRGIYGGGLGVVDLKTSKGVYETHHVQVAAYLNAGRRWADLRWGTLARLPKATDDPAFSIHRLGDLYGGRQVTQEQLFETFKACQSIWNLLVRPL